MSIDAIRRRLADARKELSDLRTDLPSFQALVKDNQSELDTLDSKDLKARADALARLNAAKELLEQQTAEINSTQSRLSSLEAQLAEAEEQNHYAALEVKQNQLLQKWEAQARTMLGRLAEDASSLYKLESEIMSIFRELHPDMAAPPSFYLLPVAKELDEGARHLGHQAIKFTLPGPKYLRVTLEPLLRPGNLRGGG